MEKAKEAILKSVYGAILAILSVGLTVFMQYLFGCLTFMVKQNVNLILILKPFSECLATAFLEECIFRFFLLRLLFKVSNKPYLIIITGSLIFAGAHAANPHYSWIAFISHFLGGIIYSYAYLKTKNIWLPFGLHFGWNFAQAILGMPVSGFTSNSFISITFLSEAFYNGGTYGLEGGVISFATRLGYV